MCMDDFDSGVTIETKLRAADTLLPSEPKTNKYIALYIFIIVLISVKLILSLLYSTGRV